MAHRNPERPKEDGSEEYEILDTWTATPGVGPSDPAPEVDAPMMADPVDVVPPRNIPESLIPATKIRVTLRVAVSDRGQALISNFILFFFEEKRAERENGEWWWLLFTTTFKPQQLPHRSFHCRIVCGYAKLIPSSSFLSEQTRMLKLEYELRITIHSVDLRYSRFLPISSIVRATYERLQQLWVRKGQEAHAQLAAGALWSQHLLAVIYESRSSLQFMRVTHCDQRNLAFFVEDGKPRHM
ncbi:hypothetical protein PIB30_067350 [Stylosanthes scabra]|uniref:Uncharacterized protein n=1 Tax=Stylosanthes scabra TaxID=79078 RepID=A0ABU6ZLC9_9FABA|nr:hypothetical protein [Stylosanthes scabra]